MIKVYLQLNFTKTVFIKKLL